MATFAVTAEHPPDLCPTSNAQTRQILKDGAGQIAQLAEQLGVDIVTLRVFGPDHVILAVVEADDIDPVRDFALQSRLMQWNTVRIHATYSIDEALALLDTVEPIFERAAEVDRDAVGCADPRAAAGSPRSASVRIRDLLRSGRAREVVGAEGLYQYFSRIRRVSRW